MSGQLVAGGENLIDIHARAVLTPAFEHGRWLTDTRSSEDITVRYSYVEKISRIVQEMPMSRDDGGMELSVVGHWVFDALEYAITAKESTSCERFASVTGR